MVARSNAGVGVEVTAALVRELVRDAVPELADRAVRLVAEGWDNAVFRVGDDLAVRLPRRALAAELVDAEIRWLPELAPTLPVPVPAPVHVGEPSAAFPWRWTIVPWFEGTTIGPTGPADPLRMADELGSFLRALHRPAAPDNPRNAYRGVPLVERTQITERQLDAFDADAALAAGLGDAWAAGLAAPEWGGPPMWIHGDLHPGNLLERSGALAAVIDFGDLCGGDPATDLLAAWALFDSPARARFRAAADDAARPIDDAMWARGRAWAVAHGLAVVSAPDIDPDTQAVARRTLAAAAEG